MRPVFDGAAIGCVIVSCLTIATSSHFSLMFIGAGIIFALLSIGATIHDSKS